MFSTEGFSLIEKKILGNKYRFNKEQIEVINAEGNANIIAGPGSGKTTVLVAKLALFLKERVTNNKGICIITHTNVAVDEIKEGLKKVGINNIEYPNFVGTIHEFFNHFTAFKAYRELFPNITPVILDNEIFKKKFSDIFLGYHSRMNPPTSKVDNWHLKLISSEEFELYENVSSYYYTELIDTLRDIFKSGNLRHNDSLSLAYWYISKYGEELKKALSKRFDHILLDEAQDTNNIQYNLLCALFNDNIYFQKFGDPYQALYTLYDNNEEAWNPEYERKHNNISYNELTHSTRFGNSIAKILKTTCIKQYSNFSGNSNIRSFKPHMLIYDSEESVIENYRDLIRKYENIDEQFKVSHRKVAVVGMTKPDIKKFNENYKEIKNVRTNTELMSSKIYQIFIKGLYEILKYAHNITEQKSNFSMSDIKKHIAKEQLEIKVDIAKCIHKLIKEKKLIEDDFMSSIENTLRLFKKKELSKIKGQIPYSSVSKYIKDTIISTTLGYKYSEIVEPTTNKQIYFGTVHSVKGETHKATLLTESVIIEDRFSPNEVKYYAGKVLFDYLIGTYIDYNNMLDEQFVRATKKALKIAYVALSRPTHFSAIAIKRECIEDNYEEKIQKAKGAGWEVVECFSPK
ncbi:UvrD-helicase domain-containing protein [Alkalihalobacillus trypoxylicola]|uniref:UvrD-like helicase ATP-binding domain-containing protein n=1 Tax=Alkalihalobacillus trypoxylicola TaxID=519424 RepID=A0A162DSR5_9BACI|nr:UvrD-helicase domain-containing protein [Alkalihalobacillus trypoxylicola]KYG30741.1 hypothetical protein AZF04_18810 [Alkalihalobacillus trypoxylicola]